MSVSKKKFAVVCSSNQNRSMEAHNELQKRGFYVDSYGTGTSVRLPGPDPYSPNIYSFGTPYETIYQDLMNKNSQLYTANKLLPMLERNKQVKKAPERFQESFNNYYDVIFTCEERCFDIVCEDLINRGARRNRPVHVINVDIKDTHEHAVKGGQSIVEMCMQISKLKDFHQELPGMVEFFEDKGPHPLLYTLSYY